MRWAADERRCRLEPYAYLRRLFAELPKAKTVEDFEALLPFSHGEKESAVTALLPSSNI
jgi:hypothetical protein